jgi:hypothetical protein
MLLLSFSEIPLNDALRAALHFGKRGAANFCHNGGYPDNQAS